MASHISLKQLKVFTTITQHNTLTAASESLFLSKAAVSMALSELEKQIGHHLFDRVNNRLILNQHQAQSLFISNSAQICDMLVDYELDIALIEGKTLHPELNATQFSEDEMCVICPPDFPLELNGSISLTELENSQWILREAGSGSRENDPDATRHEAPLLAAGTQRKVSKSVT